MDRRENLLFPKLQKKDTGTPVSLHTLSPVRSSLRG